VAIERYLIINICLTNKILRIKTNCTLLKYYYIIITNAKRKRKSITNERKRNGKRKRIIPKLRNKPCNKCFLSLSHVDLSISIKILKQLVTYSTLTI